MQRDVNIFFLMKSRMTDVALGLVIPARGVCTDRTVYPYTRSKLVELKQRLTKCVFQHWNCKSH